MNDHDQNHTIRPTDPATPRVIAHSVTVGDTQLTFRGATIPELDRYLGNAKDKLVTSSIRLATDMAHDKDLAAKIFEEKPGIAVQISTKELEAKGFTTARD